MRNQSVGILVVSLSLLLLFPAVGILLSLESIAKRMAPAGRRISAAHEEDSEVAPVDKDPSTVDGCDTDRYDAEDISCLLAT